MTGPALPAHEPTEITIDQVKRLGALIRRRRREQGLTQLQLADMSNVSAVFLNEVEKGKDTAQIGLVLRVLQALGIDLIARPR